MAAPVDPRALTRLPAVLGCLAVVIGACGRPPVAPEPPKVVLGEDRYLAAFPVGDDLVVGRVGPSEREPDNEFAVTSWEVRDPAGGAPRPLPLPGLAACSETAYRAGFALSATEVGFSRDCLMRDASGAADHSYDLVAYDLVDGGVRVLVPDPAPGEYVALGGGEILAHHDSSFCTYLARYRNGKPVELGITLEADGWPLDAHSPPGEEACRTYGLVRLPAVNRRGDLALVASTAAKGRTGNERVRSESWIYLVDGGVARRLAKAPGRPRALAWSHDGAALLVAVEGERPGVYRVTLDGKTERLTSAVGGDLAPFAAFLVMVEDVETGSLVRRLVRIELAEPPRR